MSQLQYIISTDVIKPNQQFLAHIEVQKLNTQLKVQIFVWKSKK